MLVDAAALAPDSLVESDVCIVGSGPAGLTLALELLNRGLRVVLLESGSLPWRKGDQHLGVGAIASDAPAYARQRLDRTRVRGFGGTANAWNAPTPSNRRNVRLVPLEASDFEVRPAVPDSGWPFARRELQPYYRRAAQRFGIDPDGWEPDRWTSPDRDTLPLDPALLSTRIFQFVDASTYLSRAADTLRRARDVTVFLGATAARLETDSQRRVREVVALTAPRRRVRVAARTVVLACGAIENARLLLASGNPAHGGLGNEHDVVGRYFMDHPSVRCGVILPAEPALMRRVGLYDTHLTSHAGPEAAGRAAVVAKLVLSDAAIRQHHTLHSAFQLFARPPDYAPARMEHLKQLVDDRDIAGLLRAITRPTDRIGWTEANAALRWLRGRLNVGWSANPALTSRAAMLEVVQKTEQAPDRDNRVVLSGERDALGCRTAQLHWRWTELDRRGAETAQDILRRAVAAAGVGHVVLDHDEDGLPVLSRGTNHHLGTTRMHTDPRRGVVDPHGKVHGTANLFVAGASTFPTGGYANPTLTIAALSVRLADHLRVQALRRETILVAAAG